ncbi:acyl-CoA-binding domain-containing protein 4-like [Malaya genurostris]|uniref:acyl-CoA-binding domain-containing protein 4-like n=1 Tax=Malaya genurostris TaxID=325434 RepID=UPI0026F3D061|nr:acyl-CoA-binding domain-containing protein 4-like [Malaya genurostris]
MSIEDRFNAAVNVIRSLPKNGPYQPSNDMLLTFYSLFKQATKGKCSERRPAFWDVVNRAKWDAWNRLGEMPKEVAMQKYVDELKKIVETMSYTDNVANFLEHGLGDESVSIKDLDIVAPDTMQKVRSRPNSPLASRDTSPVRGTAQPTPLVNGYHNGAAVKPVLTNGYLHYYQNGNTQSDMSDDEYIDTVDDSETEYPFRPVGVVSSHVSRNRMTQSAAAAAAVGTVELTANRELYPEVTSQLNRTIERLNASVQQVNNRINVVEQTIASMRSVQQRSRNYPPWWPFEEISPRLLAMIILWPLVANRMMVWLQRRK